MAQRPLSDGYKDKPHTLSLTLRLFLRHIWTDRYTHTHIVLLHKCSAMLSSRVVKSGLAASRRLAVSVKKQKTNPGLR